jgi:hypothetical protein
VVPAAGMITVGKRQGRAQRERNQDGEQNSQPA